MNTHNIEKSAIRRFEYVGYGGGQVWRVRKDGCGGWQAWTRDGALRDFPALSARTLAEISAQLESLPVPPVDRLR